MKFACLLALAASASAGLVDPQALPIPNILLARIGFNQLPSGVGKQRKTTSSAAQYVAVDESGGFTSIYQTITPKSLPDGAILQSLIVLYGVGDSGTPLWSVNYAHETPDRRPLKPQVYCGTLGSKLGSIINNLRAGKLSIKKCSLKVSNTMEKHSQGYTHTTSVAIYDKQVAGALLRYTTVPTQIGWNIIMAERKGFKLYDSWESDIFSLTMDGAISIAATVSVAAAIAVMEF